jgi:hypothetical protein
LAHGRNGGDALIYTAFAALIVVIVMELVIILKLLSKMSEVEDKLMSRDFGQYMSVRNAIEAKKKPIPRTRVVPPEEVRFDAIAGRELTND